MIRYSSVKKIMINACPKFLLKPIRDMVRGSRLVRSRIENTFYSGKLKWFCPCCGMNVKDYIPADYLNPEFFNPERYEHTRQDVICPVCKALPRHRILASWFENHKEMFEGNSILYFAPEYSMMRWFKRNHISIVTADLFSDADLKLDIQSTGLPDESYDIIICNHVLEHVDDFRKALKEMFRILRSEGTFICSFPMDPKVELVDEDSAVESDKERFERFGQADHQRVFGMNADSLLYDAGFEVEVITGEEFPEAILPVVGPADYDMNILFRCVKRHEEYQ